MKKILFFLLLTTATFAQNKKVAETILHIQKENKVFVKHILFAVQHKNTVDIEQNVDNATIATLNTDEVNTIVTSKNDYIEINIPYDGIIIPILLYKVDIQASAYQVDSDKATNIPVEKGVHYRGIIKNDPNSLASFNFYKNQMSGIVSSEKYKNLVIGKLQTAGNNSDYSIYSDANLKSQNAFLCNTIEPISSGEPTLADKTQLTQKCVTVYFEINYDLYVANGSNLQQANIWINSVFNNVQTLFNNDGISIAIKSVFIWTTPDPYTGNASTDYMYQFHELRPVFNGDIGQLITINKNLGGLAAVVNGLCSDNNFSYSDTFFSYGAVPTYSWTVNVIAHELGHLMGSEHTHGCYWNGNNTAIDGCGPTANLAYAEGNCSLGPIPAQATGGTIMSYCHLIQNVGVNFANGFGPQPAARIIQRIENAGCLGTDCVNTCISMITGMNADAITDSSAVLSWTETNTEITNWEIAVIAYPFEPLSTDWTTTNINSYSVAGLVPNTYYKFLIRPSCSLELKGAVKEMIFATNDDFCIGKPFVDTGGSSNNYGDYENWTRTVAPVNSTDKIQVGFTSIDLENSYDFLYIYNGMNTNAPLLTPTGITGNAIVGPFESTDSSGALTFRFESDTNTNGTGWEGNFNCITLGTDNNNFVDFSYYPNPVKSTVNITSKNEIQVITVYSIDGKLLYKNELKYLETLIDMSGYAIGTYVVKLQFENKSVAFKIIRE